MKAQHINDKRMEQAIKVPQKELCKVEAFVLNANTVKMGFSHQVVVTRYSFSCSLVKVFFVFKVKESIIHNRQ